MQIAKLSFLFLVHGLFRHETCLARTKQSTFILPATNGFSHSAAIIYFANNFITSAENPRLLRDGKEKHPIRDQMEQMDFNSTETRFP